MNFNPNYCLRKAKSLTLSLVQMLMQCVTGEKWRATFYEHFDKCS